MANSWLRLWHDMPNDPKWRTIARVSGCSISEVIAVYIHILVDASTAVKRGETHCNAEDVSSALDLEIDKIEAILEAMQGRVLDGERVAGWEQRQPQREDNSTDRVREWREKRSVTQRNAVKRDVTLDKDKDTYTEKDLKTLAQSDESLHASKPEVLSSPQSLQPAGTIPLVDGSQFAFTQADVSAWTEAYPAVDVLQQLREMREWSRANPKNRKTKAGIRRFITQWLAKEQDKPATAVPRFQAGLSPPSTQPDDGTVAREYWQTVLGKRPEQFEREAPVWIKQALRKEAGRGTQDDIRGKAGMAEGANAAEEPAVQ